MAGKGEKRPPPTDEPEDAPPPKRLTPTSNTMREALLMMAADAQDVERLEFMKEHGAFEGTKWWAELLHSGDNLLEIVGARPEMLKWYMENVDGWDNDQYELAFLTGHNAGGSVFVETAKILCDHVPRGQLKGVLYTCIRNPDIFYRVLAAHPPDQRDAQRDALFALLALSKQPTEEYDDKMIAALAPHLEKRMSRSDKDCLMNNAVTSPNTAVVKFALQTCGASLTIGIMEQTCASVDRIDTVLPFFYATGITPRHSVLVDYATLVLSHYMDNDRFVRFGAALVHLYRFGVRPRIITAEYTALVEVVAAPRVALVAALSPILPAELAEVCGGFIALQP